MADYGPGVQGQSLSYMAEFLKQNSRAQIKQPSGDRGDITQFADTFMPASATLGPNYPIIPPSRANVRGWDYPISWNTSFRPRSYEPIGFGELRDLANRHTLTHLAIETRKDQIEALRLVIRAKGDEKATSEQQKRIDALTEFWAYPDLITPFETWLRELLDDLLVIDAPAIEIRQTRGGKIIALDQVDGGTIKVLLDETGRRPAPPAPAYEQIIRGRPWALLENGFRGEVSEGEVFNQFNDGQLIYMPRNPRIWKGYGNSPVEQLFTFLNIGLRREARQLAYFTEGNIPPGMINAPEGADRTQVREWQEWFDSLYGSNDAARAKVVWGPSGAKFVPFTEPPYKDQFDEWIARIVCYAFALPHSWAVAAVNRATAQTAQDTSLEEGLQPLKKWVVRLINYVIQRRMGQLDIECAWEEKDEVDQVQQATILTGYVSDGIYTRNEARERVGLEPIDGGDIATVDTGTGPVAVSDIEAISTLAANPPEPPPAAPQGKPAPAGNGKGGQAAKASVPFGDPGSRRYLATARNSIEQAIADFFHAEAPRVARDIARAVSGTLGKASDHTNPDQHGVKPVDDPHRAREISAAVAAALSGIDLTRWSDLAGEISPHLEDAAEQTAIATLDAVDAQVTDAQKTALKEWARSWAKERAAELVGLNRVGDRLIVDTSSDKAITQSTPEMIAGVVREAVKNSSTADELTDALRQSRAFSPARARAIAEYETMNALHTATMQAFKQSGTVKGSYWNTVGDGRVELTCLENEAASPVPLGHPFPSGHFAPLAHNNCRCWLSAWI